MGFKGKLNIVLGALLLSVATFAQAGSATGNFQSGATLNASCQLTGGSINFGSIPTGSGVTNSSGSITVLCNGGLAYNILFSAGNSSNQLARGMSGVTSGNTDSLLYNIYTDTTYTTIIGDGNSGTTHPLSGSTSGRPITNGLSGGRNQYVSSGRLIQWTIYGELQNNQFITPDNYSDNLTVTVTY